MIQPGSSRWEPELGIEWLSRWHCKHKEITQHEFTTTHWWWKISINSLAPGRPGCHFKTAIFNLVLVIGIFTSSNDNALRWMPWDLTDDKSTLVQVMTWCRQATSHYLSQCWPSSMSPYGVTRPQWVKINTESVLSFLTESDELKNSSVAIQAGLISHMCQRNWLQLV